MQAFKVANSGGIRYSKTTQCVVIFSFRYTTNAKEMPYQDQWVGDVIHYTGQGMEGDQTLTRNNKVLANSSEKAIQIHLFEAFVKGENIYRGQGRLIDQPYTVSELDKNGNERIVYKFPIQINDQQNSLDERLLREVDNKEKQIVRKLDDATVQRYAKEASRLNQEIVDEKPALTASYREVTSQQFERNPYIARYVKDLSHGFCALCGQPAPFIDQQGIPFLHSHHVQYLSQGGHDTINNCIAVCPNCHARIHTLEDPKDKQILLDKIANRKSII